MTITMYELLGLVKDGKAPKKFKYDSYVWTYNYESSVYWNENDTRFEDYMDVNLMKYLDDEVEILEEEKKIPLKIHKILPSPNYAISYKKIKVNERLEMIRQTLYDNELYMVNIATKLNEVLDYLKSKGDE